MASKILVFVLGVLFISQVAMAQNSAGSSDPGRPPPPEGWSKEAREDGGIQIPPRKKKGRIKVKSRPSDYKNPKLENSSSPKPAVSED